MDGVLLRISPLLHLTRVTTAFAAVGNVWFVILWTRAARPEAEFAEAAMPALVTRPLWVVLTAGALYAVGLFAFAMALNDTLDVRRDRAMFPERPLPSGRLTLEAAVALVALTLLIAAAGSALLGMPSVLMCLLTATAVLFYNAIARFLPSVGLVVLGLIYGAHMMTPNPFLVFVWPVLLVMAHALLIGAASHLLARKRPALSWPMLSSAALGFAFWSSVLLFVGWQRAGGLWPDWLGLHTLIAPTLLAAAFVVYAWHKVRLTHDAPRAAEKIKRYGSFWSTLYASSWLLGAGYVNEALILAALAIFGLLGMTVLREVYGLIEQPVGFRR